VKRCRAAVANITDYRSIVFDGYGSSKFIFALGSDGITCCDVSTSVGVALKAFGDITKLNASTRGARSRRDTALAIFI
jgi:hypothetical protein